MFWSICENSPDINQFKSLFEKVVEMEMEGSEIIRMGKALADRGITKETQGLLFEKIKNMFQRAKEQDDGMWEDEIEEAIKGL